MSNNRVVRPIGPDIFIPWPATTYEGADEPPNSEQAINMAEADFVSPLNSARAYIRLTVKQSELYLYTGFRALFQDLFTRGVQWDVTTAPPPMTITSGSPNITGGAVTADWSGVITQSNVGSRSGYQFNERFLPDRYPTETNTGTTTGSRNWVYSYHSTQAPPPGGWTSIESTLAIAVYGDEIIYWNSSGILYAYIPFAITLGWVSSDDGAIFGGGWSSGPRPTDEQVSLTGQSINILFRTTTPAYGSTGYRGIVLKAWGYNTTAGTVVDGYTTPTTALSATPTHYDVNGQSILAPVLIEPTGYLNYTDAAGVELYSQTTGRCLIDPFPQTL